MMLFCEALKRLQAVEAVRPDIAGIMGAFGAALIARERYVDCEGTTMLSIDEIMKLWNIATTMTKCKGCTNNCRLTINHFSGGRQFITGNRCERGLGKEKTNNNIPNLFDYTNTTGILTMNHLSAEEATRGIDWYSTCTEYVRELSVLAYFLYRTWILVLFCLRHLHRKIYELGIESIPSESECYPAKLAHGHVTVADQPGCSDIFSIRAFLTSAMSFEDANNHYNCPIVTSYPENIKNNMDAIVEWQMSISFIRFFPLQSEETLSYQSD